ncbi:tetratricopeptide repeat protein [Saccharibacillus sp. CPCC 101409]|uniref:tetratricopeptide repeat protein n=1 Tax=Saccharibacillus sp. CPCC 101409 TaxID=3058041 RepID=UPI002672BD64|nr:tetratricopeptide repeat protein [Saccharibacillus sp. CPCC 101409]MDO3411588.1 tetratricopeptide repeat protein [Saccharibacillus sp. CPCC 101409]
MEYFDKGMECYKRKDFRNADFYFKRALTEKGMHAETLDYLGRCRLELGDSRGALEIFDQTMKMSPIWEKPYAGKARVYTSRSKYEEAEPLARRALMLNAGSADSWSVLAYICERTGRLKEAKSNYLRALELDPRLEEAHVHLAIVYYQLWEPYSKCLEQLDLALEVNPQSTDALFNKGLIYKDLRRYGSSRAAFEKLLAIDPDDREANLELAEIYKRDRQYDKAQQCMSRARSRKPYDGRKRE